MSRIEELIEKLCPEGVEFKPLGEVCQIIRGKGLCKDDVGQGDCQVVLYGELYTTYDNYIKEIKSCTTFDKVERCPEIKFGDILLPISSTTKEAQIGKASAYISDSKTYLGSDAILLRHKEICGYLVHLLNCQWFENLKMKCVAGTTINHLNPTKLSKIQIPIPPLEVQSEIVKYLDNFSELIAELIAELTARKQQYEYYRNQLLMFNEDDSSVQWMKLGDCCNLSAGGDVPKDRFSKEKTDTYTTPIFSNGIGKNALYGYTDIAKVDTECVTISARGTIGYCELRKTPFYPVVRLICVIPKENLLAGFLKYYVDTIKFEVPTTGIPQLTVPMVAKYDIPIPPIEKQKQIVEILDNFSKLCEDISEGLPAEIEARQKQYEYYRDKLLTFKQKQ